MRDDFTEEVKRLLANRVGNICSSPYCNALTSGPQIDSSKALNVGVAAHITSAAPDGPRYDPSLSPEQRRHPDNGIWLCQTCAKLIDNDEIQFPETVLRAWKVVAEHRALISIGKTATGNSAPVLESESQRKYRAIKPWIGKTVKLSQMSTGNAVNMIGPVRGSADTEVLDCTEFYVKIGKTGSGGWSRAISLSNIEISSDERDRLELQERYT
jgi:hypothetical protein